MEEVECYLKRGRAVVRQTTEWERFGSHGCNGISIGGDGYYIVSKGSGQGGKTKPLHWMGAFIKWCHNVKLFWSGLRRMKMNHSCV